MPFLTKSVVCRLSIRFYSRQATEVLLSRKVISDVIIDDHPKLIFNENQVQ